MALFCDVVIRGTDPAQGVGFSRLGDVAGLFAQLHEFCHLAPVRTPINGQDGVVLTGREDLEPGCEDGRPQVSLRD